jgi:CBS domain-containing protein
MPGSTRDHEPFDQYEDEDEAYYDAPRGAPRVFDSNLLRQPTSVLPARKPLVFSPSDSATDAMRGMQAEHRGCVLVTRDGSPGGRLAGIFTERDVLFRIVDRGRNPATLRLAEVMTADPERLRVEQPLAAVLQMMSVGGFRHIPIVDGDDCALFVVSVRDVVQFLVEAFPREILTFAGAKGQRERDGA